MRVWAFRKSKKTDDYFEYGVELIPFNCVLGHMILIDENETEYKALMHTQREPKVCAS